MRRIWKGRVALALLAVIFAIVGRALADSSGYQLLRGVAEQSSVATLQNRDYQLQDTVGQPFAQVSITSNTQLSSGYWYGSTTGLRQYLPLTRR